MIDTITIRLTAPQFRITDHSKFSPDTHHFFHPPYAKMGGRAYIDSYQNPTKSELKEGKYKPQLTVRKRWQDSEPVIFLYVQFSAPKILFGNNFDELKNTDLDEVVNVLNSRLSDMGVITSKSDVKPPESGPHFKLEFSFFESLVSRRKSIFKFPGFVA